MTLFRRQAHAHSYQPVAVNAASPLFGGPATTVILRRCSCSDVESKTIAGRWTLAQVQGRPEPPPAPETGESES